MKNRKLLLTLVILLTFTGGFFTGMLVSSKQESSINIQSKQAPLSAKNPGLKQKPDWETEQTKVLMGYVQDYRDPNVIDYDNLTHVIFSFVHPTKDGNLLFNGETALNNLRTIVTKAHQHDTKVMLAIGGWYHIKGGESYKYFKEAISNPISRRNLVNELVHVTNRENLNGIDIDFEHPRSNEDAKYLTAFTKELSEKLHEKDKELSIAVNAKVHSVAGTEINNVVYEPTMFKYVDHVNIMAYDGQWDGGYNAANLSPYPYTENIVNYWTNLFNTHNLSKEKLVLGVPFYAQPENPNSKQLSYAAIIKNNPKNANRNTVSINGTTYYYNGEDIIQRKTKLALNHGFGGMMMWEVGLDAKGTYSLTGAISETLAQEHQFVTNQSPNSNN